MTASGTHRARGVFPRGPLAGLLGLILGTPALLLAWFAVVVVAWLVPPPWALAAALVGAVIGASALRMASARRTMVRGFAAIAGLILLVLAAAVVVLEVFALLG